MTAFQAITKSTTEHLGAAQFNRPPLPAKRHGFSPPFTLSRWGGLRTPSESFALQWEHIDWDQQRITIPHVKTKSREIPLFPEIVPHLRALQKVTTDLSPGVFLFVRLRQRSDANLRKQMTRLVRFSGNTVWPKIFTNLRSSRQTELEERFPRKTVCEWMGNSETVADQHYLQVRDEHFEQAVVSEDSGGWDSPLSGVTALGMQLRGKITASLRVPSPLVSTSG